MIPPTVRQLSMLALPALLLFTPHVGAQAVAGVGAPPAPSTSDPEVHSPVVAADRTVTFRLYAPNAAEVLVKTEGLDSVPGIPKAQVEQTMKGTAMTKGPNGVWAYTLGPVMPGAFRYTYVVDGVSTTDPVNPISSESLTHQNSMYFVSGNPIYDMNNVPHGTVGTVFYHSSTLGTVRRMHVYTPPGYEEGRAKSYPVLYLLHGGGDSDESWTTVGLATTILDNLIAQHRAVPMIVVLPAGHVTREMRQFDPGRMGLDSFNDDFLHDVVPYVEGHYRVSVARESRAIAGLSMGGVQTLNIGLTHLKMFSSLGVFSSGWFPPARAQFVAAHAAELDSKDKQGLKLLWVGAGKEDIAHDNSLSMVALLKEHGFNPEYHESFGYHTWSTWQQYISDYLPRLFQRKT